MVGGGSSDIDGQEAGDADTTELQRKNELVKKHQSLYLETVSTLFGRQSMQAMTK